MNRRKFLRTGSLTGMGLTAAGLGSLQASVLHRNEISVSRDFPSEELEEITICQLQKKMQESVTSSVSLIKAFLDRIQKIDKQGPRLNAVIEINPDALTIAARLDQERKQGKVRGPLHGIPVMVKDNINTGDKMMTTAGSIALAGNIVKEDAFIMRRLREAGVVLLGKTNLSEWANFRSSRSTSGWSSRGGQTKCPYILDRNPSGSSAGSGAATAASLCVVSVGTETDGSIVSPASVNGLVGIKPTVGLWSRSGIIPISATQDTAGPMARTVTDAAILLGAGTGADPDDPVTEESNGKAHKDYTSFLTPDGLKGKRIGVEKSHFEEAPDLVLLLKSAIKVLEAQGAAVVQIDLQSQLDKLGHSEYQVLLYEFKDGLNRYLTSSESKVKSLKELIAFNLANESRAMPFFKQEILLESEAKGDLKSKEYVDALSATLAFRKTITDLMFAFKLDALSGITNGAACCIDLVNGDYASGPSRSTTPAAITGFPHITVPMGFVHGLPVGISFYGNAYTEPALIAMAYAFEQASNHRRKPAYRNDLLG